MSVCEVCGNDYDKAMQVTVGDATHVFESFECAIQALAPTCGHCGCRASCTASLYVARRASIARP